MAQKDIQQDMSPSYPAGVVTPGEAWLVPKGADLVSIQNTISSTNFNGATVTLKVQGTNDDATVPTTWTDIANGGGTGHTANGNEFMGTDDVIAIGLYYKVRVTFVVAAGPPADLTIVSDLNANFEG